jgi:hypothetical protein
VDSHNNRRTGELADGLRDRIADREDVFDALLGRARSESEFGERQSRRWQSQVDEESATWEGTLLDLAEAQSQVALDTTRGTRIVGQLIGVGTDVLVVRRSGSPDLWVRLSTVATAGILERSPKARGSRIAPAATIHGMLFDAAGYRPNVSLILRGVPTALSGVLMSCGADVCTVRTDGDVRRSVLVHLASIDEVTIHG